MTIHLENKKLLFIVNASGLIFRLFMCVPAIRKGRGKLRKLKGRRPRSGAGQYTFAYVLAGNKIANRTRADGIKKVARTRPYIYSILTGGPQQQR